jgi:hypothetical protein
MKRIILAVILLAFPLTVWAQQQPQQPPDPTRQALVGTVSDLTQVWIATRTQLAAAENRVAILEAENAALKGKSDPAKPDQPK